VVDPRIQSHFIHKDQAAILYSTVHGLHLFAHIRCGHQVPAELEAIPCNGNMQMSGKHGNYDIRIPNSCFPLSLPGDIQGKDGSAAVITHSIRQAGRVQVCDSDMQVFRIRFFQEIIQQIGGGFSCTNNQDLTRHKLILLWLGPRPR